MTEKDGAKFVVEFNDELFVGSNEILERVQEVKYEDEEDHMTIKNEVEPQLGPFVCTPVTPRTKSAKVQSS